MKFTPCQDNCTYDGTHCEGCGRSHEEIKQTKQLVMSIVNFAEDQEYENVEEFGNYLANKVTKKLQS